MVQLTRYPTYSLGHFPTPFERMERLEENLHRKYSRVPKLWIKRDDCTGLATGGNKTRKLEFLIADALEHGADTVITQGAVQSNHTRQTAAAAAIAGLDCLLLLEKRQERDDDYEQSGNVLLERILGAKIVSRDPAGTDMPGAMEEVANRVREQGGTPYIIPGGGSNAIGALGYVACAKELDDSPVAIDWVLHTTGSCGTQAGLVAGLRATHSKAKVLGISNRREEHPQVEAVEKLAQATSNLLDTSGTVTREDVRVDDRWVGGGYGVPSEAMMSAIYLLARTEGILLDPVYTGKGFAGLLGNIADGTFGEDENVVFLHTGGSSGLFGYRSMFDDA